MGTPLISEHLRAAREKKGLSQRDLAIKCGIAFNMIYRYETGLTDPSVGKLQMIANVLEVSLDYLVGAVDDPRGQIGEVDLTDDEKQMVTTLRQEGWPGVIRLGADRVAKQLG